MLKIFDLCVGYNMWYDKYCPLKLGEYDQKERDFLLFDEDVLDRITSYIADLGYNAVVLELAESIKYACAPEIGVKGSLLPEKMSETVQKIKNKGLEVIPKLDFSAAHDVWLGDYSYMLSSSDYNELTVKLIDEVCEIFHHPKYFHLGLGDEYNEYQQYYGMIITRGAKSFKRDVDVMLDACRKNSAQPIVSAEFFTREPEVFRWVFGKDVIVDAYYSGVYCTKSDFFGRDKRSDSQKLYDGIFELENPVIASLNRATSNFSPVFYEVAKAQKNTVGLMASPFLPTVNAMEIALKSEAKRMFLSMAD